MINKKLPVGIEFFDEMRREDFYYVDKTGLIIDLLANWGKVNLFTRPRRFGKTLNIRRSQKISLPLTRKMAKPQALTEG